MTAKVLMFYAQPDDPDAFDRHYREQHMPLARAIPGAQHVQTGLIVAEADGGDPLWYRVTEVVFADRRALDAGLASPEAQAATADYAKIAPPGSRILIQVLDED
jgi:uncharacterized protein (TIGR02118 family)